jgi:hypothetical protein
MPPFLIVDRQNCVHGRDRTRASVFHQTAGGYDDERPTACELHDDAITILATAGTAHHVSFKDPAAPECSEELIRRRQRDVAHEKAHPLAAITSPFYRRSHRHGCEAEQVVCRARTVSKTRADARRSRSAFAGAARIRKSPSGRRCSRPHAFPVRSRSGLAGNVLALDDAQQSMLA